MNTDEIVKDLNDAVQILQDALTGNVVGAIAPAIDLVKSVIEKLPPINAPALDPVDRAHVDAEMAAAEDAAVGKAK